MLKAKGKLYTLGNMIGLTGNKVCDISVLKKAIISDKLPLVSSYEDGYLSDPTKVIGYAELKAKDDGVYAYITFNDLNCRMYKEAFNSGYEPRLSFYATNCDISKDGTVNSMIFRSVSLNEIGLGGKLDEIWED